MLRLEALMKLCTLSTPGDWIAQEWGVDFYNPDGDHMGEICLSPENCNSKYDMKFIAAAHFWMPDLILSLAFALNDIATLATKLKEAEVENKFLRNTKPATVFVTERDKCWGNWRKA